MGDQARGPQRRWKVSNRSQAAGNHDVRKVRRRTESPEEQAKSWQRDGLPGARQGDDLAVLKAGGWSRESRQGRGWGRWKKAPWPILLMDVTIREQRDKWRGSARPREMFYEVTYYLHAHEKRRSWGRGVRRQELCP